MMVVERIYFLKFLFFFFFFITFSTTLFPVCSTKIYHISLERAVINLPARIEASVNKPNDFAWANIFYKKKYDNIFLQDICFGTGRFFYCTIPEAFITESGTDYYIEVLEQDRDICRSKMYSTVNDLASSYIQVHFLKPKIPKVKTNTPDLYATISGLNFLGNKETIKVYLDNYQVFPEILYGHIQYTPKTPLTQGTHSFKVEVYNEKKLLITNKIYTFDVLSFSNPEQKLNELKENGTTLETNKAWETTGNLAVQYNFARSSGDTSSLPYPNGYYNINTQFASDNNETETSIFLGPLRFTSQKSSPGVRNNAVSAGFTHKKWSTQLGTISSSLTPLSGGGASILGVEIIYNDLQDIRKTGFMLKTFAGQSKISIENTNDDTTNVIAPVYGERTIGFQFSFTPVKNFATFSLQGIDIRDDENSVEIIETTPYYDNTIVSGLASLFIPEGYIFTKFDIELGTSFNKVSTPTVNINSDLADTTIIEEENSGSSLVVHLAGDLKELYTTFATSLQWSSSSYLSASSDASGDSFSVNNSFSHNLFLGIWSFDETFSYLTDNITSKKDSTSSTLSFSTNHRFSFSNFPSLSLSNNITTRVNDSSEQNTLYQFTNALQTSASYTFNIFKKSISSTLSFSQNDSFSLENSTLELTSRSHVYTGTASIPLFSWLSYNNNYSMSIIFSTEGGTPDNYSESAQAGITITIWKLSFPASINFNRSFVGSYLDDATTSHSFSYSLSSSFSITQHSFSLSTSLSDSNSYINYNINFSYNYTL